MPTANVRTILGRRVRHGRTMRRGEFGQIRTISLSYLKTAQAGIHDLDLGYLKASYRFARVYRYCAME